MNKIIKYALLFTGVYIILNRKKLDVMKKAAAEALPSLTDVLSTTLKSEEGFSSKPYWDSRQWSWGYGTKVPNSDISKPAPNLTINKVEAVAAMLKHMNGDINTLQKKAKFKLMKANQQAAIVLASYNLGLGFGLKVLEKFGTVSETVFKDWWLSHNKAKNKAGALTYVKNLAERRNREVTLFFKPA